MSYFIFSPTAPRAAFFPTPAAPTVMISSCFYNEIIERGSVFEADLVDWCRQYCTANGVFIDAGAHTNTYTVTLAGDWPQTVCNLRQGLRGRR